MARALDLFVDNVRPEIFFGVDHLFFLERALATS